MTWLIMQIGTIFTHYINPSFKLKKEGGKYNNFYNDKVFPIQQKKKKIRGRQARQKNPCLNIDQM